MPTARLPAASVLLLVLSTLLLGSLMVLTSR